MNKKHMAQFFNVCEICAWVFGTVQMMDHDDDDMNDEPIQESEVIEESLSIQDKEIDLIKRALSKHNGKRKNAAKELGISERTLYRKIKEYNLL